MKPLPHRYGATITAGPDGYGTLSSAGVIRATGEA